MKIMFTILVFIFSMSSIFAGDVARKGTTGAEQLLIPVGARGIASGGAFLSNITGIESIYYNPAGLDIDRKTEAMFSYMSFLADINVSYFAIGTSLGELGSVGFSIKTLDFGDIDVTTNENPDGTGTVYSPSFLTAGLTYSKVITDRVTVGVNAKVISETIMQANATGFALDLGVQYRFQNNLSLGASVKNIGTNMRYAGQDLQSKVNVPGTPTDTKQGQYEAMVEDFQIPSYFELSTTYIYNVNEQNNFVVGTTFRNNNSFEDQLSFGLEYGFQNTFFIRSGYNMLVENNKNSIYGLTLGAGINSNISSSMDVTIDYAFRDVKDFPNPNHVFAIKLGLK